LLYAFFLDISHTDRIFFGATCGSARHIYLSFFSLPLLIIQLNFFSLSSNSTPLSAMLIYILHHTKKKKGEKENGIFLMILQPFFALARLNGTSAEAFTFLT
jgi:hypothetical protein